MLNRTSSKISSIRLVLLTKFVWFALETKYDDGRVNKYLKTTHPVTKYLVLNFFSGDIPIRRVN